MSGIAELLANLGYVVTGSDEKRSSVTARLSGLGIGVAEGHATAHVGDAEVVVVSSAVRATNPEVAEALRRRIPVIPRAEMLAELMRLRYSIAVAGAHGKTTTTSMIALVLERAGLDPTAVIGGRLSAFGSNARLGRGELMVAEADESYRSFLKLFPTMAVVTTSTTSIWKATAASRTCSRPSWTSRTRCPSTAPYRVADDPRLVDILPRMTRRVVTSVSSQIGGHRSERCAAGVDVRDRDGHATRVRPSAGSGHPGRVGEWWGVYPRRAAPQRAGPPQPLECPGDRRRRTGARPALRTDRQGARRVQGRRTKVRGTAEIGGVLVVDDYGHHPTEIAAVLSAAQTLGRRVVVAFQPHRYSRTAALMDAFGPALVGADRIVLTDIYAAGEEPIPGVTLERLAAAVRASAGAPVDVVPMVEDVASVLAGLVQPGDLVITLGAGSIGTVADRLIGLLSRAAASEIARKKPS